MSTLPTTSLYLTDALSDSGIEIDWERNRIGDHIYRVGDRAVIIRYASEKEVSEIEQPYIYVLDDHLPAVCEDQNLPDEYRIRIKEFVCGPWSRIVESAKEIVVSSDQLGRDLGKMGYPVKRLHPYWKGMNRSQPVRCPRGEVRMAWLASRAHAYDLESTTNQLERFFRSNRKTSLTVLAGKHITKSVKRVRGIRNLAPLPWRDYQTWLNQQCFDIVIHPLLDTPVNRARSLSKWCETAQTGAVPLISRCFPWTDWLDEEDAASFLVGPSEWEERLNDLTQNPQLRAGLSRRAAEIARAFNEDARKAQVNYWTEQLDLKR